MRLDATSLPPVVPLHAALPVEGIGDAHQEAFQRALHTMLGQSMPGQVLSRLTDGSFLVRIAGNPARMALPPGSLVGTEVSLTLIALDPRPTFHVGSALESIVAHAQAGFGLTGTQATGARALLHQSAPLTMPMPDFDPDAPILSTAARTIATVLMQAESGPGAPLALIGKTPLLLPPALDPERLAHTLHETVGHSGLFYESHVAEWAEGKRTLPELLREPQALRQGATAPLGDIDQAAAQLINLQLHTHEQARVVWQGEAWPGQPMEWTIHKDAPQGGKEDTGEPEAATWRSGVRFEFALLGAVSASLLLIKGQLQIRMQAASAASATALRDHAAKLEQALAAAGAPLTALAISQAAAPEDVTDAA